MIFGPYDTLDPRSMMVEVMDEFGNTTFHPVLIEVYTPIPTILSYGSGSFSGNLDEVLSNEPVDAFRIRPGSPLSRITESSLLTSESGLFTTRSSSGSTSGIRLSVGSGNMLIDGAIPLPTNSSLLSVYLIPADSFNPMRFQYRDVLGITRFESFLSLPENTVFLINPVSYQTGIPKVIIRTQAGYQAEFATARDPGISGGMYITDSAHMPIAALAPDGNIYALQSDISLQPIRNNNILQIDISRNNQRITTIEYQIPFFTTIGVE